MPVIHAIVILFAKSGVSATQHRRLACVTSAHDFDLELICDYFSMLERQGPGSPEATLTALSFIDDLGDNSRIADIGCGSGGQTMVLAQHAPGDVTGIDLFPYFIDLFNRNAAKLDLQNRVKGIVGSMDNLPFSEERPAEIDDFWNDEYPEIDTVANKVAQMQKTGYIPVANFILPEECWTEHFYKPQIEVQKVFLKKNAGNKTALEFIENQKHEARLYHKYKEYYGYAFYIGKKS